MEMKQNKTFFNGTYLNLTPYLYLSKNIEVFQWLSKSKFLSFMTKVNPNNGNETNSWTYSNLILFSFVVKYGWPTKMSLFFFGDNFYKNKDTFKILSPQILEVYRILFVETTLESIMFYDTF